MKQQIKLLNKSQKAKELGISKRTLDRWIGAGKVSFVQFTGNIRKFFFPGDSQPKTTYDQINH